MLSPLAQLEDAPSNPGDTSLKRSVTGCGCKSWFCKSCAVGKGLAVRAFVRLAVAMFSARRPVMITLTHNPALFDSPQAAHEHVRKKSLIAEFVRRLRSRGLLKGRHYFCVTEFHDSGWCHWHLVVDADFINHAQAYAIWDRLGPNNGRTSPHNAHGYVSINKGGRMTNRLHAADYLTKYLVKQPAKFPDWVMDNHNQNGIWKRCTCSKGLRQLVEAREEKRKGRPRLDYGRSAETIRGRVAQCGSRVVLFETWEKVGRDGEIKIRRKFKARLGISFCDIGFLLGCPLEIEGRKHLDLTAEAFAYLSSCADTPVKFQRLRAKAAAREMVSTGLQGTLFDTTGPPEGAPRLELSGVGL